MNNANIEFEWKLDLQNWRMVLDDLYENWLLGTFWKSGFRRSVRTILEDLME